MVGIQTRRVASIFRDKKGRSSWKTGGNKGLFASARGRGVTRSVKNYF
mgnify:CR=1 FL=1